MAKKKASSLSSKKGKSSKASSKLKPKSKTTGSTKKKALAKGKEKKKTSNSKKSVSSKIKKKPVAKTKPKTSKGTKKSPTSKKSAPAKKAAKKTRSSSAKKKPADQKVKSSNPKKVISNAKPKASPKRTPQKPVTQKSKTAKQVGLSSMDRYNLGGLLACSIGSAGDSASRRLKKALNHLGLSTLEQENLVRQAQGFMVPRLFADSMKDEDTRQLGVKELVGFAKTEKNYERDWQSDLERIGIWLGVAI